MDAVDLILDNLDVEALLKHYRFEKISNSGNYYRACCKLHDGDNPSSFVINVETGLWSCHTGGCGSGSIFHLVQKLDEITFPEAVHKIAKILSIDINDLEITAKTKQDKKELKAFLEALKRNNTYEMEAFEPIGDEKKVKKFKGFNLSTIEHFGLTYFETFYSKNSKDEVVIQRDVLGFPIIREGVRVGYSLRATRPDAKIKWMHQPSSIKTGLLLYNYDNVIGADEVIVVEGITDVWAYHEIGKKAVATYGAHLSEEQYRMLMRLGSKLVFSFDGDNAGRTASRKAYDLFHKTSDISFVTLPEGKDPENIPREDLKKYYEQKSNSSIPKNPQPIANRVSKSNEQHSAFDFGLRNR